MRHLRIEAPSFDIEVILQRQLDRIRKRQLKDTLGG
jgi:hypothetical protein